MSANGLPTRSTSTSPDAAAPVAPVAPVAEPPRPTAGTPATVPVDSATTVPARRSAGLFRRVRQDERGEGVISAAIAVLIMAFVGVAAFIAYRGIMSSVTDKTTECVDVYVSNGSGCD